MAKRTADQLSGTPLSLVYIADNTADAHKAERVLSEQGVDYALSLEPFASASVLLVGERTGLFVYVPAAQHRLCVELLDRNGLKDTVDMDETATKETSDGA